MWHYVLNGERVGPVDAEDLQRQIAVGVITAATLVWRVGMSDWTPAGRTEWAALFAAVPFVPEAESTTLPPAQVVPAPVMYATPVMAAPPRRPTSVTVFATLLMVFGGLSLLCVPLSYWFILAGEAKSPIPFVNAWIRVSVVFGLVAGLWQVVSGIGLLQLKQWARRAAMGYGWYAIVLTLVGLGVNIVQVVWDYNQGNMELLPFKIGATIGSLAGFIFPVLLLIFMRKPRVVEACVN